MKTIFIFNDSRPTDEMHAVMALGEDGLTVARITFDPFTLPHCRFAMGAEHLLAADDADITDPVNATRATVLRRYDEVYGAGNWLPIWLDAPQANPEWRDALNRHRERNRHALHRAPVSMPFSTAALAGILGAIFGSADNAPHTTH